MDAYAFAPDGSFVTLPGMCVPLMNTILDKGQDLPVYVHNVRDRHGRPLRVIYTTLDGRVLYAFAH